ncbi:MAG: hypothetical protein CL476_05540 [Acidobacteria bacterium]|nr:hypothetical protein [Acidobacteriota bacterium]
MTSENSFPQTENQPAQTMQPSFGSRLRAVALWSLVFLVVVAAAFGTGYFLQEREILDLRHQLVAVKADAASDIATLERRVLEAEKTQLEHALERASLNLTLNRVLAPLPLALADVEQRNFGHAMERIATARRALDAPGISQAVREVAGGRLDAITREITTELRQVQQAGIGNRLAVSAHALERVLVTRDDTGVFVEPLMPMAGMPVETPPALTAGPATPPAWEPIEPAAPQPEPACVEERLVSSVTLETEDAAARTAVGPGSRSIAADMISPPAWHGSTPSIEVDAPAARRDEPAAEIPVEFDAGYYWWEPALGEKDDEDADAALVMSDAWVGTDVDDESDLIDLDIRGLEVPAPRAEPDDDARAGPDSRRAPSRAGAGSVPDDATGIWPAYAPVEPPS